MCCYFDILWEVLYQKTHAKIFFFTKTFSHTAVSYFANVILFVVTLVQTHTHTQEHVVQHNKIAYQILPLPQMSI